MSNTEYPTDEGKAKYKIQNASRISILFKSIAAVMAVFFLP